MSDCGGCGGKVQCTDRKGSMLERLAATLARLYPTRRWGEPDDEAAFRAGVPPEDGRALAEELAAELRSPAFYRPGGAEEPCDYVWILCVGRTPCLLELREGAPAGPDPDRPPVVERYLRLCLSAVARVGAVQEVSLHLEAAGDDGTLAIREAPRAGVYDGVLLPRLQKLVAILPAYGIDHLDFGEISAPPDGFDPGDYTARFGRPPDTANYLFFPQPSDTQSTTVLASAPR